MTKEANTEVEETTDTMEVVTDEAVELNIQKPAEDSATTETKTEAKEIKADAEEQAPNTGEEALKDKAKGDAEKSEKPKAEKPLGRVQKRINTLTKRQKEAESRAEKAEAKVAKLEEAQHADDKEPDPANYDEYNDYLKDLGKWDLAQNKAKETKPQAVDSELTQAIEDIKDTFEDESTFNEIVSNDKLVISRDMVLSISGTENPAEIVDYLSKNLKESERIAQLSPIQQAREIGKLEATVKPATEPQKKQTKAPDLIKPVGGTDTSKKDVNNMSFSEYEAHEKAKQGNKKGFW